MLGNMASQDLESCGFMSGAVSSGISLSNPMKRSQDLLSEEDKVLVGCDVGQYDGPELVI